MSEIRHRHVKLKGEIIMFIITYDHRGNQNSFNSKYDEKHAYACKLDKFNYNENGLEVGFKFTPALPKLDGKGRVLGLSNVYEAKITKEQFNEIRSRILAHNVISWNIVNNIINDVKEGK
jgi:hypothetical protein